jgi:hypothetical protein
MKHLEHASALLHRESFASASFSLLSLVGLALSLNTKNKAVGLAIFGANAMLSGVSAACPADPVAVDTVPTSPALSSTRPQVSVYPTGWRITTDWWSPTLSYTTDSTGLVLNAVLPNWYATQWWLVPTTDLLFIRNQADFKYKFSFEVSTNDTALTPAEIKFALFKQTFSNSPIPPSAGTNSSLAFDYQPSTTNFTNWSATWVPFQGTVSSKGNLAPNVPLGVYFRNTASFGRPILLKFRKLRVDTLPTPITAPTLISKNAEYVTLRKPSTTLDPNNRTECPHLQSGLKLWHDNATWGGVVPSPSSVITLPANSKVLITSCSLSTAVYEKIIVPAGSELIFNDAPINLNIKAMLVQGHLRIGSPNCRLYSEITITLHGAKSTSDTIGPFMGSKGIGVPGKIDIHGKQYHYTWTRLAATAWPGDNQIWLQDNVNWHVGQQVVVTSTDLRDEETKKNEVMTITAISGRRVQFNETFKFIHYAGAEYQAEVGLLSRRITIQGAADSETAAFGGHIMVRGEGRFSGVRGYRMGQTNVLARYPFHFHMIGQAPTSYMRDCTVQRSFFRCVSIHGTHQASVIRNVAYDVSGHCYYLEEGVEENNTIAYNLASHVHTIYANAITGQAGVNVFTQNVNLTLPADVAASGFYITNAYNRIFGNSASGGWAGFAFPNLAKPIGMSANVSVVPELRPVLEFDGNTAHSAGFTNVGEGIPCIYMGGRLWTDTATGLLKYDTGRQSRNPVAFNRFTNTKTFACHLGIMFWGIKLEVSKYESHDCVKAGRLFSSYLDQALIVATTNNTQYLASPSRKSNGFEFYDTDVKAIITNVEYRNFLPVPNAPLDPTQDNIIFTALTHSDVYKPQGIAAVKNITYTNVPYSQRVRNYYRDTGSSRYFSIYDYDGTTVGRTTPQIIGSYPTWWAYDNTCVYRPEWKAHYCDKGSREVISLAPLVPGWIDYEGGGPFGSESVANVDAGVTSLFYLPAGVSQVNKTCKLTRTPQVTGVSKVGWHLWINQGAPRTMRVGLHQVPFGQWVLFATNYPAGTTFNISLSWKDYSRKTNLIQATSLAQVMAGSGTYYYFQAPHLYIKMVDPWQTGGASEYWESQGARLYNVFAWRGFYNINATCTANAGGYCTIPNTVPSISQP